MKQKIIFILLSLTLIFSLTACGGKLTKGNWTGDQSYCFAVDVDDYDGDVYQSGNYHFELDPTRDEIPSLYEIYVSDEYISSSSLLTEEYYVNSIGGLSPENDGIDIELPSGSYVYIIPVKTLYEPSGILRITMNK